MRVISRTKAEGTIIIHMNLDLRLLRKTNIQFNEVGSELQKLLSSKTFTQLCGVLDEKMHYEQEERSQAI